MTVSFGVSMEYDLKDRIERTLDYGDKRSQRIVELIKLGLEVEEAMAETGTFNPDLQHRIEFVRDAVEAHAEDVDA